MGIGKKITKIFLLTAFISAATLSGTAYADSGLSFSMQDPNLCGDWDPTISGLTRDPSESMYDYCNRAYDKYLFNEAGTTDPDEYKSWLLNAIKEYWDGIVNTLLYMNPELQSDKEYHEELADAYVETYFEFMQFENMQTLRYAHYNVIINGMETDFYGVFNLAGRDLKLRDCTENSCVFYDDEFGTVTIKLLENNGIVTTEYILENTADISTDYNITILSEPQNNTRYIKNEHGITLVDDDANDLFNTSFAPTPSIMEELGYGTSTAFCSWQGQISKNETRKFTMTYDTDPVEMIDINFYYLGDGYTTPTTNTYHVGEKLISGDNTPFLESSKEWNTKPDGTGSSLYAEKANRSQTNYYEIERRQITGNITNMDIDIIFSDDFLQQHKEAYAEAAIMSLSDVMVGAYQTINVTPKSILKVTNDNYRYSNSFIVMAFAQNPDSSDLSDDLSFTMKFKLPKEYLEGKKDIAFVRSNIFLNENSMYGYTAKNELLPVEFNRETGELSVEYNHVDGTDSLGGSILGLYHLVYTPLLESPDLPEEPEIPGVPNTGVAKTKSNQVTATMITLPVIASAAIYAVYLVNSRKANRFLHK